VACSSAEASALGQRPQLRYASAHPGDFLDQYSLQLSSSSPSGGLIQRDDGLNDLAGLGIESERTVSNISDLRPS